MVNNWRNIIQDCLLPPTCLLCGEPGNNSQDLCLSCRKELPYNNHCCSHCQQPFIPEIPHLSLCGQCQKQQFIFDDTHSPFIYEGAMRHMIQNLKFNGHQENARLLGTLLADTVNANIDKPDYLVPVPLHKRRYRERGFNQSIEIAKVVAKRLKIPLDLTSCQRQNDTVPQTELSGKQRRANLRNAFLITHPLSTHHVAIIDDVMTTGTTANEVAKTLKKSGVQKVDVWVCARA